MRGGHTAALEALTDLDRDRRWRNPFAHTGNLPYRTNFSNSELSVSGFVS